MGTMTSLTSIIMRDQTEKEISKKEESTNKDTVSDICLEENSVEFKESRVLKDPTLPLDDSNFLKCACCGKYKVDTDEDFYVNFGEIRKKYWLCEKCNHAKNTFDRSSSDLVFLITPGRTENEDYAIFTKESVCM